MRICASWAFFVARNYMLHIVVDRSLVKAHKGEVLFGHKYKARRLGPDGRWIYTYDDPTGAAGPAAPKQPKLSKRDKEMANGQLGFDLDAPAPEPTPEPTPAPEPARLPDKAPEPARRHSKDEQDEIINNHLERLDQEHQGLSRAQLEDRVREFSGMLHRTSGGAESLYGDIPIDQESDHTLRGWLYQRHADLSEGIDDGTLDSWKEQHEQAEIKRSGVDPDYGKPLKDHEKYYTLTNDVQLDGQIHMTIPDWKQQGVKHRMLVQRVSQGDIWIDGQDYKPGHVRNHLASIDAGATKEQALTAIMAAVARGDGELGAAKQSPLMKKQIVSGLLEAWTALQPKKAKKLVAKTKAADAGPRYQKPEKVTTGFWCDEDEEKAQLYIAHPRWPTSDSVRTSAYVTLSGNGVVVNHEGNPDRYADGWHLEADTQDRRALDSLLAQLLAQPQYQGKEELAQQVIAGVAQAIPILKHLPDKKAKEQALEAEVQRRKQAREARNTAPKKHGATYSHEAVYSDPDIEDILEIYRKAQQAGTQHTPVDVADWTEDAVKEAVMHGSLINVFEQEARRLGISAYSLEDLSTGRNRKGMPKEYKERFKDADPAIIKAIKRNGGISPAKYVTGWTDSPDRALPVAALWHVVGGIVKSYDHPGSIGMSITRHKDWSKLGIEPKIITNDNLQDFEPFQRVLGVLARHQYLMVQAAGGIAQITDISEKYHYGEKG
jgi:hypothetical protein